MASYDSQISAIKDKAHTLGILDDRVRQIHEESKHLVTLQHAKETPAAQEYHTELQTWTTLCVHIEFISI
jgi:hypothetical protein